MDKMASPCRVVKRAPHVLESQRVFTALFAARLKSGGTSAAEAESLLKQGAAALRRVGVSAHTREAAQRELVRRMRLQIAACALPPRRARSCQRKVRQPINKWPRMMTPSSLESPSLYEVTIIA